MKYTIKLFRGDHPDVYKLIAPYAMNRKVITEMDGYPILTSDVTVWFVAMEDNKLVGFAAIVVKDTVATFTYAYTLPEKRNKGIHKLLFKERMKWSKEAGIELIKADCTQYSLRSFIKKGFTVVKAFVKWTKVEKAI